MTVYVLHEVVYWVDTAMEWAAVATDWASICSRGLLWGVGNHVALSRTTAALKRMILQ